MAQQGRTLDESTMRMLERVRQVGQSIRESARLVGVAKSTAQKYLQKKSK